MKKLNKTKVLSLILAVLLVSALLASCGTSPSAKTSPTPTGTTTATPTPTPPATSEIPDTLPRNETLYFNGLQWGAAANFNPIAASGIAAFITPNVAMPREVIYETMFAYNQLDGKLYPLLGTEYTWNGQELTVKLNPDAKWNDGEAVTADDVVYTYKLGQKYSLWLSSAWTYISDIVAVDDHTVKITGKADNFNTFEIEYTISSFYILPEHVWSAYETEVAEDGAALMQLVNFDLVASGPYKPMISDETKLVFVRDDNYWGQAASMFGKLPAPKYLAHNLFKDNPSGDAAFKAGEVDISQQYVAQIWNMWESGAAVETYLPEAPYYIPGSIPSIIFNMTKPGLDDKVVRKAIAMSLDYNMIGQNAMSGYTAPLVPSLMLPTATEQALIDADALKPYQWASADLEKANQMLDEAGWVKGSDGIRAKNGVTLSFQVECPAGWTDWNASLEVVAQASKDIGMDIQTYFPDAPVWVTDRNTGNFDILMTTYSGTGINSPWARARQTMSSVGVPAIGESAYFNFGRYKNERADELVDLIASEKDPVKVKAYWTEINQIYLEDVPSAGLMYRPAVFHQVNTTVWEGFPRVNDGSNVPPCLCLDGYGVKGLYNLTAK